MKIVMLPKAWPGPRYTQIGYSQTSHLACGGKTSLGSNVDLQVVAKMGGHGGIGGI